MLFLLIHAPQKLKLEKVHGVLIILFYVGPSSLLQSCSKENTKILSKNTTRENITVSRQNLLFFYQKHKNNHSSASDWWKIPNLVLKRMLERLLKIPLLKKILECQDWGRPQHLYKKGNFKQ